MNNTKRIEKRILDRYGKSTDERRVGIFHNASIISLHFILCYSMVEIIVKIALAKSLGGSIPDLIRLLTIPFVYLFFVYDNNGIRLGSGVKLSEQILSAFRVLFPGKKDERLYQIGGLAAGIAYFYTLVFVVLEIIWRIFAGRDHSGLGWDYGLLAGMLIVLSIFMRKDESYGLPEDENNQIADGTSRAQVQARWYGYLKETFSFSVVFFLLTSALTVLPETQYLRKISWNYFLHKVDYVYYGKLFILYFVLIFLYKGFYGEYKVRHYNKKMKKMEEDN